MVLADLLNGLEFRTLQYTEWEAEYQFWFICHKSMLDEVDFEIIDTVDEKDLSLMTIFYADLFVTWGFNIINSSKHSYLETYMNRTKRILKGLLSPHFRNSSVKVMPSLETRYRQFDWELRKLVKVFYNIARSQCFTEEIRYFAAAIVTQINQKYYYNSVNNFQTDKQIYNIDISTSLELNEIVGASILKNHRIELKLLRKIGLVVSSIDKVISRLSQDLDLELLRKEFPVNGRFFLHSVFRRVDNCYTVSKSRMHYYYVMQFIFSQNGLSNYQEFHSLLLKTFPIHNVEDIGYKFSIRQLVKIHATLLTNSKYWNTKPLDHPASISAHTFLSETQLLDSNQINSDYQQLELYSREVV